MSMNELERARQDFAIKRGLLGLYTFLHFAALVPYAAELFSNTGMLAESGDSPLMRAFPNLLGLHDSPTFVQGFVVLGALSGLLLGLGIMPTWSGGLAYYAWACLFTRNPLIANPSLPYVGLMLLTCAVVGRADRRKDLADFERVKTLLWIAMAMGYSYSGITKLSSPSWLDGSAVHAVLQSPLARPHALRDALLHLDPLYLHTASFLALSLEVLFAPLALWRRARPALWLGMLSMHVSLVALIQFADLSIGMLVLHALTYDPRWLSRRARREVAPLALTARVPHDTPAASYGHS